jgi:hypothetical protein
MKATVYKSGHGWIKQYTDGTTLGPFENKSEAQTATLEKKESKETFGSSVDSKEKKAKSSSK